MIIREMDEKDVDVVSAVCLAAFSESVAGDVSAEGIATFSKIAASAAFLNRMQEDNVMLVAESNGEVGGIIELKQGRHVAMLFVAPEQQRQGIGKRLFTSVLSYVRADALTVRASLSSVPAYEKYGFECKGEIGEVAGLVYQPMEMTCSKEPSTVSDLL